MHRLLTKRDKNGAHRRSKSSEPGTKSRPLSGNGILSLLKPQDRKSGTDKKQDAEFSKKVEILKQRVRDHNITGQDEGQIEYALGTKYAHGDVDKAFEMLLLFQESVEGIVRPYDPNIHMRGAENREAVTCYLDSLLFAMFARLGSFEPILYTHFDDEPRRRLSTLIRLWVNMLRTGKLIQTDITEHLQNALASCGWEGAAELCQQDTSEAFGFITEKLQLPLLTMEMDIFHEGKGDATDDHKFINERLLEVAIPQEPHEGRVIRLEDCLEEYFNARVEVVRRLDRRNTLQLANTQSYAQSGLPTVEEKEAGADHVEYVDSPTGNLDMFAIDEKVGPALHGEIADEGESRSMTPVQIPNSPVSATPTIRRRATSIIRRVIVTEDEGESSATGDNMSTHSSMRKGSLRKEVLMPAWQFFRIIPWYTAQVPANDDQVAAHFSSTRPVLGICLKRYAMSPDGRPVRLNTNIDIPLQIALPHFIQDDKASPDGPLFGNFNLVLQSVVCHRGTSVHAGHYISLIRGTAKTGNNVTNGTTRNRSDSELPEYSEDQWIKFDDLAPERVTYVDIEKAMAREMPYLLFYQVQPLCPDEPLDDPANRPPSYQDSGIGMVVQEATPITTTMPDPFPQTLTGNSYFEDHNNPLEEPPKSRISFSDDIERPEKPITGIEYSRRDSVAHTDTSSTSLPSAPVTPGDEVPTSRLSRAASRFGRRDKSKSRPSSHADENRISATFSRLGLMGSRSSKDLSRNQDTSFSDVVVNVTRVDSSLDEDPHGKDRGRSELEVPPLPLAHPHTEPTPSAPGLSIDGKRSKKDKEKDKGKGKHESKSEGGTFSNLYLAHPDHNSSQKGKDPARPRDPERECALM